MAICTGTRLRSIGLPSRHRARRRSNRGSTDFTAAKAAISSNNAACELTARPLECGRASRRRLCCYSFVVHADEKLTAFVGFESATRGCGELACQADEIFGKTCRDQDLNPGRGASPDSFSPSFRSSSSGRRYRNSSPNPSDRDSVKVDKKKIQ